VVDPIDGTRAFIAGRPDWTVSVALVEDGQPVAAALYAPVPEQMFLAARGAGARLNGAPMRATSGGELTGAKVAGPKKYLDRLEKLDPSVLPQPKVHSLALRLTRVGEGALDVAFSSGGSHDWDLAAAHLLVHEAGALLTDFAGRPISFNRPHVVHGALIAAGPARHGALLELVRDRMPEFA
jgi:myo-inositol-1(or 4)-monophosphatase